MRALVTGGTGFIGSHLVESLIERGFHVRCLVRKTSDLKWLRDLPIELAHGDCIDKDSLGGAVKGVDLIFHVAGVTKAIREKTYFEINAFGTENLIHAWLEQNTRLQKFLYLKIVRYQNHKKASYHFVTRAVGTSISLVYCMYKKEL